MGRERDEEEGKVGRLEGFRGLGIHKLQVGHVLKCIIIDFIITFDCRQIAGGGTVVAVAFASW